MSGKGSPRGRAASTRAQAAPPVPPTVPVPVSAPEPLPDPVPVESQPDTAPGVPPEIADVTTQPAAAPIDPPPVVDPPEPPVPFTVQHNTAVVVELSREQHEGVLDEQGNPVDLAVEFELASATGNVVVLKRTLLETYRLPGTTGSKPRLGRRLLMTAGTQLPVSVADQLVQAQQAERVKQAGESAVVSN